jgi:beta-lactamase regulating signal transducer with metallopeptidase domain
MKLFKRIIASVVLSIALLVPAVPAFAVELNQQACEGIEDSVACEQFNKGKTNNPLVGPEGIITTAVSVLSIVLGIICVLVIFIAGIRFALSQGNPQSVTNARNTIIYAVVGMVVAAIAQAVVQFVLSKLS